MREPCRYSRPGLFKATLLSATLAFGGCFGSRLRAAGDIQAANSVAAEEGIGLALCITGPFVVKRVIEDPEFHLPPLGTLLCADMFIGLGGWLIWRGERRDRRGASQRAHLMVAPTGVSLACRF